MLVRAPGGVLLFRRTTPQLVADPNALDDEHAVLDLDVPLRLGGEMSLAGVDLARLQRATQRAGESTCRRRDHVIERRGVRLEGTGLRSIMLRHLVVYTECNRLGLRRKMRLTEGTFDALDPNVGDIGGHPSIVTSSIRPRPPAAADRSD